jgi:hypothetical protein
MKTIPYFAPNEMTGGFAYISENEIQSFFNSINNSENISEHKYRRRKLSKAASAPEPGVVRKRGRPRKHQNYSEKFQNQVAF